MERAYRIANLWNWLPAFRTVAETQHLPTAARALHVSPSALSRSVKQLEEQLGFELFERDGRRIRLNRAGEQLLAAVRDAMRRVHDGLASSTAERVRIAAASPWLRLIVRPALRTCGLAADLLPEVPRDPIGALLRGDADLVIGPLVANDESIIVEPLGAIAYAVCWSPNAEPDAIAVWTAAAVARPAGRIAVRSADLAVVVDACVAGDARAILPVAIARAHGLAMREIETTTQLHLARRRPLGTTPLERLAIELRAEADRVLAQNRRTIAPISG